MRSSPRIAIAFGVIAIVLPIVGPLAWGYGHVVVRGLERDQDARSLRWATAGRRLGMVATGLLIVILLAGLFLGVSVPEEEVSGGLGAAPENFEI